jgi:hypothetical protein
MVLVVLVTDAPTVKTDIVEAGACSDADVPVDMGLRAQEARASSSDSMIIAFIMIVVNF